MRSAVRSSSGVQSEAKFTDVAICYVIYQVTKGKWWIVNFVNDRHAAHKSILI